MKRSDAEFIESEGCVVCCGMWCIRPIFWFSSLAIHCRQVIWTCLNLFPNLIFIGDAHKCPQWPSWAAESDGLEFNTGLPSGPNYQSHHLLPSVVCFSRKQNQEPELGTEPRYSSESVLTARLECSLPLIFDTYFAILSIIWGRSACHILVWFQEIVADNSGNV